MAHMPKYMRSNGSVLFNCITLSKINFQLYMRVVASDVVLPRSR